MAAPVAMTVGHVATMTIVFLDQSGNPMLTTPTPDSPPVWTDVETPAGISALVAAASGLSATETPTAPGTVMASVSAVVGGATFAATQELDVSAAPQVLTSISVATTVA